MSNSNIVCVLLLLLLLCRPLRTVCVFQASSVLAASLLAAMQAAACVVHLLAGLITHQPRLAAFGDGRLAAGVHMLEPG